MAAKSAEDIFCAMSKLHDGMKSEKPGCTLNRVKRSKDPVQQFFALRCTLQQYKVLVHGLQKFRGLNQERLHQRRILTELLHVRFCGRWPLSLRGDRNCRCAQNAINIKKDQQAILEFAYPCHELPANFA